MPTIREIATGLDELFAAVDAILDEPDDDGTPQVVVPQNYAEVPEEQMPVLVPITQQEIGAERRRREIVRMMTHNGGGKLGSEV